MKPVSRASGRTAIAAAAYRAACMLLDRDSGEVHDYSRKAGVVQSGIILPEGVDAGWARDRESLWNAAEAAEKRKDARVAREFEVALPEELSKEARAELVREFAQGLANRYGTAVDFAIHAPSRDGDSRNYHAHVLMTVRRVTSEGLEEKTEIERENGWLGARGLMSSHRQLKGIRKGWERLTNEALGRAGLDIRVDCRSHEDRGLHLQPSVHVGVQATELARQGVSVARQRLDDKARQINTDVVRERPEELLALLTGEKSVFTAEDVRRALWRCRAAPEEVPELVAGVLACPAVVELQGEPADMRPDGPEARPARYSTQELIDIETGMADRVLIMHHRQGHRVADWTLERSFRRQVKHLGGEGLSREQRMAVTHITGAEQIAVVIGHAGSGKSTMLAAARETWESDGRRVLGGTLAGKAAEGLEAASGITSRTLASWERGWKRGKDLLARGDVLVIDEAGMLGSRQMAGFVAAVERAGAKLVLVGDAEQLQAIGPGGAFRAIADRVGAAGLDCIRRQEIPWQREASMAFATQRTAEGLKAYVAHGNVRFCQNEESTRAALAAACAEAGRRASFRTQLALAHRRVDVRDLNDRIRNELRQHGALAPESEELVYETRDGPRGFVVGDRLLFLENNRELGVKNGSPGVVTDVSEDEIEVKLDSGGRFVPVPVKTYDAFDHGYATTIHKAQGATVSRAFVLASSSMDRHLAYVAMTRHRHEVTLFADRTEFRDMQAFSARLSRAGLKETTLDYLEEYTPPAPQEDKLKRSDLDQALINYGMAAIAILRNREEGLPVLSAQRVELRNASHALEGHADGLSERLGVALKHDEGLRAELPGLSGQALSARLKEALAAQDRLLDDPSYRLEQFVMRWKEVMTRQEDLYEKKIIGKAQVRAALREVTEDLAQDPVVEMLLKSGQARLATGADLEPEVAEGLLQGRLSDRMERLAEDRARAARARMRSRNRSPDMGLGW